VFGILMRDGRVDLDRTRALVGLARPMSATFHRAFDVAVEPFVSLKQLVASGVDRVLTSGHARSALAGVELITKLVQQGDGHIAVMPGGGIAVDNAKAIRDATGAGEIHVGTGVYSAARTSDSSALFSGVPDRTVDAGKVARLLEVLR